MDLTFIVIAGWSSLVARRAHNPKVVGSNPAPAICFIDLHLVPWSSWLGRLPVTQEIAGSIPAGTVSRVHMSAKGRSSRKVICGCSLVVKRQPSKL